MNTPAPAIPDEPGAQDAHREEGGPAPISIVVSYGFWIFLLSDIIMFSALFAAYAVLSSQTAGGPGGKDLFDLRNVGLETASLLLSSYTCGLGLLSIDRGHIRAFYGLFSLTFLCGACFFALEMSEFSELVAHGNGPAHSAFLSAFFSLVGLHGAHIAAGLLWLTLVVAQVATKGTRDFVLRRLYCFSLFWHALDIIWVALLSLVYLLGARA